MPEFGKRRMAELAACHQDLRYLFEEVIKHVDCTVTCGYRGKADQNAAFAAGRSRKRWPNGNHNSIPSMAVDVYPYPIPDPKTDKRAYHKHYFFAGYVLATARQIGIPLRLGLDWDSDLDFNDQT